MIISIILLIIFIQALFYQEAYAFENRKITSEELKNINKKKRILFKNEKFNGKVEIKERAIKLINRIDKKEFIVKDEKITEEGENLIKSIKGSTILYTLFKISNNQKDKVTDYVCKNYFKKTVKFNEFKDIIKPKYLKIKKEN